MANGNDGRQKFGGDWTRDKLQILERYLDGYTTALKNQPFRISYIDAFAGTGWIETGQNRDGDQQKFLEGSTRIAYGVRDKRFDKLVFIEKDARKAQALETQFEDKSRIDIKVGDANQKLQEICTSGSEEFWNQNRAVVFLDPFALEVKWATVEAISKIPVFDVWILFPVGAIRRMLPRHKLPGDVDPTWASKLNSVFGDESWKKMYRTTPSLFGNQMESVPGTDPIADLYKEKLQEVFPGIASKSATLQNSRGRPLFEFMFAISNPSKRARDAAFRIANHILNNL